MKEVRDFYLLLHPRPAYVIGSGRWGERVNFMAASWVSPVGEEPPSLIVALGKESLTLELIEIYGEFTVNVIPISLVEELYYVGSRSGRDEDKSRVFKAERGEKVSAPIVKDPLGVLECKLMNEVELGDVKLVIGEVLSAKADERFFNERTGWNFKKISIPLHNWGRGFFKVGEFVMAKGKG
jgi:flavin reductase (DIM6/NTAB) family NADH-FMN oxidoreductase RutF